MSPAIATASRAFVVRWDEIDRWSVGAVRPAPRAWAGTHVRPLGVALERRVERVPDDFELLPNHFISIRFNGHIEPRDLRGKTLFKGHLFFAYPGDIVYSKIDVRNGAIGVIPTSIPVAAVTTEFPVYRVRDDVAIPDYIQLVFRTERFRALINAMVSGASGRKRVQPERLEELAVPLPARRIQEDIVRRWHESAAAAAELNAEARSLEESAELQFLDELGLGRRAAPVATRKVLTVSWRDVDRWGVRFNQLRQTGDALRAGRYPLVKLGDVLETIQYGTSVKANSAGRGIPVLRIKNIKDGRIDFTELKHVPLTGSARETLLLRRGDVLIIRTSGSRDLVGTSAEFDADGDYVFASYLMRLRFDERVVPAFGVLCLNSPIGRAQVEAVSRKIMQNNINAEEIRELEIPRPPRADQEKMVASVTAAREASRRLRLDAQRLKADAVSEVEERIGGAG